MLLPVTSAFLLGLVLGFHLPYIPATVFLSLALLAGIVVLQETNGSLTSWNGFVLYAALLAGVLYWTYAVPGSIIASGQTRSEPIALTGTVVESVHHGPHRMVLVLESHPWPDRIELGQRVRVTWRWPNREIRRGDHVALRARLDSPAGTLNPGGFDYGAYLRRTGIDAVASVSGPGAITLLTEREHGAVADMWRVVDRWRNQIRQAAVASLTEPARGIYLGIIIGEASSIRPELRDDFMATGTVHILSISGSHLGLIAILVFVLVQTASRALPAAQLLAISRRITPTRLAAVTTIFPVAFYTLLAGAEVATIRSFIMIALFLIAVWLGREQNLMLPLGLAALVIVLHDPAALFAISFQLSFLSVLAIALALRWSERHEGLMPIDSMGWRVGRWLRSYLWISGAITLITIPLVAYYFNQIAWLGLLANLVAVPFAGFVLVPLGLISAIATLLTGGQMLAWGSLNQTLLDLFCWVVSSMARVPGAEWHVASPAVMAVLAYYSLLFLAMRPGGRRLVRVAATVGVLVLLVWWTWSPRFLKGTELRVAFLDVGQGDAAVLELPDGQTVLIDGGAAYDTFDIGRSVVAPYLWDRGIRRVDHVIGTHPQLDHVGGLASVLRKFEIGEYWDNGMTREEPFYRHLHEVLESRGIPRRLADTGRVILNTSTCQLEVLNPPLHDPRRVIKESASNRSGGTVLNNFSVVTRLVCGPHSYLFTADIETQAIARMKEMSAFRGRIVKVPHHGARGSLDPEWVHAVHPDVAVISVGRRNAYGHPAAMVVKAYQAKGAPLLRTDEHGAVWFTATMDSPSFEIHTARDLLPRPVHVGRDAFQQERVNLSRLFRAWQSIF
jgi:competence protein ComEC